MRIADNTLRIISFIIILVFCCWGCHEDPLDKPGEEKLRPGQLTVEEAYDLFREYAGNTVSRSVEAQPINLDPGIITAAWDDAALSTTPVNSFVNVPIRVTDTYLVKSPYNKDWVSVSQKLVIVQEDATRRHNIYLLSLFPEGDFATRHRNDISGLCQAGQMPEDFSGLAVYTKTRGGLPVHVGVYREGRLTKDVFLFDKRFSFEENLDRMNSLLRGYSLKTCNMALSRSFSESGGGSGSGSGGSGGNWQFHTEGGSFQQGGYTCWNSTDSNGNHYVVADMDGDGKPDTILGGGTDVGEGSGGAGGSTNPGGGTTPGGGDINPGEGTNPGTGTGGSGSGNVDTGVPEEIQKQIKKITDALKKIGLSNEMLNKLTVRMGILPVGYSAILTSSGSIMNILFGDTPFVMTFDGDTEVTLDMYKCVIAHEYYHFYLYGISREAGSMVNLYNEDQKLQALLNKNLTDGIVNVNDAHHEYMGYDNVKYEQFLRDAFPGEQEEFYKYGKWGGGVNESDEYKKLSSQERDKIEKYLTDNKLLR